MLCGVQVRGVPSEDTTLEAFNHQLLFSLAESSCWVELKSDPRWRRGEMQVLELGSAEWTGNISAAIGELGWARGYGSQPQPLRPLCAWCWIHAGQSFKSFTNIDSLSSHDSPMIQVELLFPFYRWRNWGMRERQIICPRAYSKSVAGPDSNPESLHSSRPLTILVHSVLLSFMPFIHTEHQLCLAVSFPLFRSQVGDYLFQEALCDYPAKVDPFCIYLQQSSVRLLHST